MELQRWIRSLPLTRRQFLQTTGVAGAAAWLGTTASGRAIGALAQATPQRGGKLVIGFRENPPMLDPHQSSTSSVGQTVQFLYDRLVYKAEDGTLYPWLATKWETPDDGSSWTFTLRPDVKFTDGEVLDAAAVKFNFDRVMEVGVGTGKSTLGPLKAVEVVDPTNVRFVFDSPWAPFLDGLDLPFLGIASPAAIQRYGDDFTRHPVGSGPWVLKEWVANDHLTFVRNEAYQWGPTLFHAGPAYPEELIVKIIPDVAVAANALEAGEVGLAAISGAAQFLEEFRADDAYHVYEVTRRGTPTFWASNVKKPPFDDLRVRQAVGYLFDKPTLLRVAWGGEGEIGSLPLTPGVLGYSDALAAEFAGKYNPDKAQQLLEDAGWTTPGGDGIREQNGKALEISFMTTAANAPWIKAAEILQHEMQQVGMKLTVTTLDAAGWYDAQSKGEFHAANTGLGSTDPHFPISLFFSSKEVPGYNFCQYEDPKVDELIDRGAATIDTQQREEIYDEIQRTIMSQALIVPMVVSSLTTVTRANVHGLVFNTRAWPEYFDVYVD